MNGIRHLFGDALIAIGTLVRPTSDVFSEVDAMGAAGLLAPVEPDPMRIAPKFYGFTIPPEDVRAALDELRDSELLGMAATIIEGWTPILFTTTAGTYAARDVPVLIEALRDRAAQFYAVEEDADKPFLTETDLNDLVSRDRGD